MNNYCLEVIRADLTQTRTIELPGPAELTLAHGEAVISVKRFGLTANNITYGVAGDIIGYWQFFPAEGDYGRIPVWGVGTVIDPGQTDLKAGDEYYGYYPMASYLVVKPTHVTSSRIYRWRRAPRCSAPHLQPVFTHDRSEWF